MKAGESMRQNFAQILKDAKIDIKVEYQKLYGMLYDRSIPVSNTNRISVYDELSTYFIAFCFRGTCLSLDEFNDLHGFHFEKDPTNFNIDHLISLCEYIENLLIAYQCVPLSYPYGYGNMPTKLIDVQFYLQQISQVIEKIGYMQAKQNDLTIFVEKDPAAIAVAEGEFIPESLSYRLISYNHYSMKGNLAEKKTTLLDLANLLEPQRTNLERIDKTFSSDLFYTFNNFHIRHNNIDQLGTKYKKPVGDLSDEQLEYWYDEVYQMCLLAFMRLEHIDRKKKFDSLKSQIEVSLFEEANLAFLQAEHSLFRTEVAERTLCGVLMLHIHDIIKEDDSYSGYYADVEYNRNAGGIKTIRKTTRGQQEEIIPINCDLILHSRGENVDQDNLIAIEMKKSNAPSAKKQKDRERLIALTKDSFDDVWAWDHNLPEHVCRYVLGVYYEINYRQKEIHIEYYRRGELVRSYSNYFVG